jgi:1,4-alpha-glucan branching enzyme/maltooligosyltrehalose trehalohydrolase
MGDRIIAEQPVHVMKAMAAIYLLAPQIPMLFMGEEWGARDAFPYFCDLNEELNEMVRNGRREELSRLPGFDTDDLLDPTAPSTFEMAKLDWSNLTEPESVDMHDFYTSLLAIRHQKIVPLLAGMRRGEIVAESGFTAVAVDWPLASGGRLCLRANLGDEAIAMDPATDKAEAIFGLVASSGSNLSPWSVYWSVCRE